MLGPDSPSHTHCQRTSPVTQRGRGEKGQTQLPWDALPRVLQSSAGG